MRATGERGRGVGGGEGASEKAAELAQKLGQLHSFTAAFPQQCMAQLCTYIFWANPTPFSLQAKAEAQLLAEEEWQQSKASVSGEWESHQASQAAAAAEVRSCRRAIGAGTAYHCAYLNIWWREYSKIPYVPNKFGAPSV